MKNKNLNINYNLMIIFLNLFIFIGTGCSEEVSKNEAKKVQYLKLIKNTKKTAESNKNLFESLNCNPPEIENFKILDSIYTNFSFKIYANKDHLDSIFVSKHKFIYESNLKIEVGFYNCSSKYSDGYFELCNEDKYVHDSIRSYIKIGNKKMFIDKFFQKVFKKQYFYFNHFSDQYKIKKLRFSSNKYYISFFPCYYFGAQSWFNYLPILFEIKDDQLSQIFIMPQTIYSDDPYQFTDYNSDGEPEWIGVDDSAKMYEINSKKITLIDKYKGELQTLDHGYTLKDTVQNWPCKLH